MSKPGSSGKELTYLLERVDVYLIILIEEILIYLNLNLLFLMRQTRCSSLDSKKKLTDYWLPLERSAKDSFSLSCALRPCLVGSSKWPAIISGKIGNLLILQRI